MSTKIEWCDETINPLKVKGGGYHCTKCSPGCMHCYAERINMNNGFYKFGNGLPYDDRDVEFELDLSVFDKLPKKGCRVFVQSMGDLFHRCVSLFDIKRIIGRCTLYPQHTFIILTKRPVRAFQLSMFINWPENVYLGVTVCNASEKHKIDTLRKIPAAVRLVSLEPMLEDMGELDLTGIHWVILGCESGQNRRPCEIEWMESVVGQCREAGVACFVKQVDINGKASKNMDEWPPKLQIQEFPRSNP